jgi:hypothetical protein
VPRLVLAAVLTLAAATAVAQEAPDEAEATDRAGVPAPPSDPPVQGFTPQRTAAWATLAGGFAFALTGGILLAVGVDDINRVENAPDGVPWSSVEDAFERAPRRLALGAVLASIGVAALGTGMVLLATAGEGGTWLEARLGLGRLTMRGRF